MDVEGSRVRLESIEGRSSGNTVSSHILEVKPVSNMQFRKSEILSNAIHRVASRSENGALVLGSLIFGRRKNERSRIVVIEEDAVEALVDSIVDVVEELVISGDGIDDRSLSVNVDGQSVRFVNEESSGFSDDFDFLGEELIDDGSNGVGDNSEVDSLGVRSGPSPSKIEQGEVVSDFFGFFEDSVSASNGGDERVSRHASRTNVEGNSNDVEVEFLSEDKELSGLVKRSSKLGAESADRLGVVSDDSKNKSGVSVGLRDLDEFVRVIEGHHVDVLGLGELEVRLHLARVGKDNSRGIESASQDLLNLGLGSAIEVSSKRSKKLNDSSVGVALDGKEGLNSGQMSNPFFVLSNDSLKIDYVESLVFDNSFVDFRSKDCFDRVVVGVSLHIVFVEEFSGDYGLRDAVAAGEGPGRDLVKVVGSSGFNHQVVARSWNALSKRVCLCG